MLENEQIQLVPADPSLAGAVTEYYRRNKAFLEAFEPVRDEEFFTLEHQRKLLEKEAVEYKEKTGFRFYIRPASDPGIIIGSIALSNVVWGPFCSAFLGYKLDERFINKGYMSMALSMLVEFAFDKLRLHRIEGNVMPRNKASLRVLEKNHFVNEGISKCYLNIHGVWEDHVHMVRINYDMHSA